jgi:hypothetical protein
VDLEVTERLATNAAIAEGCQIPKYEEGLRPAWMKSPAI